MISDISEQEYEDMVHELGNTQDELAEVKAMLEESERQVRLQYERIALLQGRLDEVVNGK